LGKPRKKSTAKAASESAFLELVADAWPLHLKRTPMREIAKILGKPLTCIHRAIERGRQIYRAAISAEDNKARVDERRAGLEAALAVAWKHYTDTADLAAVELVRKCEADLRKMFGDDAIQRSEVEVVGGIQFLPKEQMLEQALAGLAKLEQQGK
jgi:hypothetical protein